MADVKISALPAATTPLAGTEVLPIVQSSTTKKVAISDVTAGRAISASSLTLTTPLSVANGGTGLTSLTAGYIPYGNGTGAFSNVSTFVFDGTNLGVGTGSPSSYGKLTVRNTSSGVVTAGLVLVNDTASAVGTGIGLYFAPNAGVLDRAASIQSTQALAGNTADLRFFTSNYDTPQERIRITYDGSVGIGTTSPGAKLDVSSTSQTTSRITAGSGANASPVLSLFKSATLETAVWNGANAAYTFGIARNPASYSDANLLSATQLLLDSSGNLGLGVTPSAWAFGKAFELGYAGCAYWATAANDILLTSNAYYNAGGWKFGANGYANRYDMGAGAGQHRWYITASNSSGAGAALTFTQAMTLDASGNLYVGNTSALISERARFTQNIGSGGTGFIVVDSNATGYQASMLLGVFNDTTTTKGFLGTYSNHALSFRTSNTEKMIIDASGNVVINTAAIATNATDGFLYVPTCAGTPTGTPTTYTGRAPIVVDTTNNKLYFYSGGAWRDAGP